MPLSKPTLGGTDYAARIGILFDLVNNGNYPFPATQVPSADPNTLDDYEEGTWTPSLGGTATYTTQSGIYTKKGREVTALVDPLTVNAIGTGNTGLISGLPFTVLAGHTQPGWAGPFASIATSYTHLSAYVNANSTQMGIGAIAAAGVSMSTPGVVFGNGASIYAGATYFTA